VVAVVVLVLLTVLLHRRDGGSALTGWWASDIGIALTLMVPGLIILHRQPGNVIGRLLYLGAALSIVSGAGREYLLFGTFHGHSQALLQIAWFTDSMFLMSMATLPAILLLFPDPRSASRTARRALVLPLTSALLGSVGQFVSRDSAVEVNGRLLQNPVANHVPPGIAAVLRGAAMLLFLASLGAAVVVLVLRYRRSTVGVRQQMRWVVWAGGFVAIELVAELTTSGSATEYTAPLATALISGSICVAIVRHRLFDIDLIISRTVVFLVLSGGVVLLYLGLAAAANVILGAAAGPYPALVAAAIVGLALNPARTRLQLAVDRRVYGYRRSPYLIMTELGEQLEQSKAEDELDVVVLTVTQSLKLPCAAIVDLAGRRLAETGDPSSAVGIWPLAYRGSPVGELVVGLPERQPRFDRVERTLLDALARPIGAAVHAVGLAGELQESRRHLVQAKEEERRRLRRDLHDGIGPRLAAASLRLEAAEATSESRPPQSKALMRSVQDDLRTAIDDIRQLVSALRPAMLDELGLVSAIGECARGFGTGPGVPRFEVTAPELPSLPAAVEVAAYRIACESLTNTVRHAGARLCTVRLELDEEKLELIVSDDGVGMIPDSSHNGVGLASMRERAEELGGATVFSAGDAGRGTTVHATLPRGGSHG